MQGAREPKLADGRLDRDLPDAGGADPMLVLGIEQQIFRPRADPELASEIRRYDETADRITLVASTVMKLFVACGLFAALLAISGLRYEQHLRRAAKPTRSGCNALAASGRDIIATFVQQGVRQLARGLGVSAALTTLVLLAISQRFSLGAGTMALLTVVAVVSACVLLSIYLAVRGNSARTECSAARRLV